MDLTTVFGLAVGFLAIVIGSVIEGGPLAALVQGTAFIIVFGGTIGATIVSNRQEDIELAFESLKSVFKKDDHVQRTRAAQFILEATKIARSESVVAIDNKIAKIQDLFLKRVLRLLVDGADGLMIREVFEIEIDQNEQRFHRAAKVWADAGGFAPTVGIIGAVLGLIHVMSHLSDTSELGKGIAVAFVATVYGVASANLVFIPIANKIKAKCETEISTQEMIMEGVISIADGSHPLIVSHKLQGYVSHDRRDQLGI